MQAVNLTKKGIWPVAGGTNMQSPWFLEMVQLITNDQARVEREIVDAERSRD